MTDTSSLDRYRERLRQLRADVRFEDWVPEVAAPMFIGPRGEKAVQAIYRGQTPQLEKGLTDGRG